MKGERAKLKKGRCSGRADGLRKNNVTVTRSRIVIGNQTYPVANITSIRIDTKPPSLIWPVLMGVIGIILLIAGIVEGGTALLIGVVLIAVAVIWWRQAKPAYTIYFGTAGGERRALESDDAEYIERVARAKDEALIAGKNQPCRRKRGSGSPPRPILCEAASIHLALVARTIF